MLITDERFFCEELDPTVKGLEGIDVTFREKGLCAAEKQLADFIRGFLRPDDYLKTPLYDFDSHWVFMGKDMLAAAEDVISGKLCSAGGIHQFPGGKIDWNFNPTYNGYLEWPWQLNRHHQWKCLGDCYRKTGDEKYAECYAEQLMSWCEQVICPTETRQFASADDNYGWRTIEAGIRMRKNWHYAFHCMYRSPALTDHVITTYFKSVWEHAYRLTTANTSGNWLIMELVGVAHICILYPIFKSTSEWKKYAYLRLEKELDDQIYPDGFQVELSTNYHDVIIHNYDMLMFTAEIMGEDVPKTLAAKLKKLFLLDIKIVCPDGRYPDLNDGGRGLLAEWCRMGMRYYRDDAQIRYFATEGKEGELPDYTSVALPYSGHAYMRTGWGSKDIWMFMDAGPFGKSHQHEDKLNVLMFAYGKNLLPDSGNYAYDNSEMRRFILSTYSHNCGLVDGKPQDRRPSQSWSRDMVDQRSDMKWRFTGEIDAVEGEYTNGFGASRIDVTHKRKLLFFKQGIGKTKPFAVVVDRYLANDGKEHEFATSFQLDNKDYTENGEVFTQDHGNGVTLSLISSATRRVLIGQKEPYYIGWRKRGGANSKDFEHYKAPAVQYVACGMEKRIATVLYPSDNGETRIVSVRASDDPSDTTIILELWDGSKVKIDENDHPCYFDSEEKLSRAAAPLN